MKFYHFITYILIASIFASCHMYKHVPEDKYLLNSVTIDIDGKDVKSSDLKPYVRQYSNPKTLGLVSLPLVFYNMSGSKDNRWNKFMRRIGTPPVVFDSTLTSKSISEITKAMANRGYIEAEVSATTKTKRQKLNVTYHIDKGEPYRLNSIKYNISDTQIEEIINNDSSILILKNGGIFDHNKLEEERDIITEKLRNLGYYSFTKEYINFRADTTIGNNMVDLELNILPFPVSDKGRSEIVFMNHDQYKIRNITYVTQYNPMDIDNRYNVKDTVKYKGSSILYGDERYIKPSALVNNTFIRSGADYRSKDVDNTLSAFSRLHIIKYVNIQFAPSQDENGEMVLDCYIMLTQGESQSISTELEGTNSAGDFGFAVATTYQHRDIFKGSQTLSAKVRGAFESLTGDFGDIISNNYFEFGSEVGISFPKFIFPFAKPNKHQRLRPITEFNLNINFQQRPEFMRVIAGGGWAYKWSSNNKKLKHQIDLIDVSYVYLPRITDEFSDYIDEISEDNPLLRYSYEDHFIMRMQYSIYLTNLDQNIVKSNKNIYTFRSSTEIAGNLLYGISSIIEPVRPEDGYSIWGITYSQYFKQTLDYTYTFVLNERHSLSLHAGTGVAVPYANSDMLPFEKRFFSGGANSVRGWSIRGLGPGSYTQTNATTDFMNQCGDVRLDLNAEYRTKLVWKLELATFIDAGNIWTIKAYDSQPNGEFKFNRFYKEIALAYGAGLRLDFSYFVLRLDLGMKTYDPSMTEGNRWVICSQNFKRDAALHFAVGYPF